MFRRRFHRPRRRFSLGKIVLVILVLMAFSNIFNEKDETGVRLDNAVTSNVVPERTFPEGITDETTVEAMDITASKLIEDYEANEIKGNQLYRGKLFNITGVVEEIQEIFGSVYVRMSSDDSSWVSVEFSFDDDQLDDVAELVKGQEVTIQGVVKGYSLNIDVEDSKILKN